MAKRSESEALADRATIERLLVAPPTLRLAPLDRAAVRRVGRALRQRTPRSSWGRWTPAPDRPDPVAAIIAVEERRDQGAMSLRHARMSSSAFAFYRGTAHLMAMDLAGMPVTGVNHVICGDAHAGNFGLYASPERALVFDLNDFDESRVGPWEWDVLRLSASFVLAARHNRHSAKCGRRAVRAVARSYRSHIAEFTEKPLTSRTTAVMRADDIPRVFSDVAARSLADELIARAVKRTSVRAVRQMVTGIEDGAPRFREDPPLIRPLNQADAAPLITALDGYLPTMPLTHGHALRGYRVTAVAHKVVGVGSIGLRDYLVLLQGHDPDDVILLQLKQATDSQLDPFLPGDDGVHDGERIVRSQRLMQAVSDSLLGWTSVDGVPYYIRQFRNMKGSVDLDDIRARELAVYAELCGATLARAHARAGSPGLIAAYLGRSERFEDSMGTFALAYADQVESDHAAFVTAIG